MHLTRTLLFSLALPFLASCASSTSKPLSFGQNYAVLNLDLINGVVAPLTNTTEGKKWINSTATWIDAFVYLPSFYLRHSLIASTPRHALPRSNYGPYQCTNM
jgi:hypothetical protein